MTTPEKAGLLFVAVNLIEELVLNIRDLKHEAKREANILLRATRKFSRTVNNKYNEQRIDEFDEDTQTLLTLIEANLKASKDGKETEFMNYIKNF